MGLTFSACHVPPSMRARAGNPCCLSSGVTYFFYEKETECYVCVLWEVKCIIRICTGLFRRGRLSDDVDFGDDGWIPWRCTCGSALVARPLWHHSCGACRSCVVSSAVGLGPPTLPTRHGSAQNMLDVRIKGGEAVRMRIICTTTATPRLGRFESDRP